jgi:putative addiction module CopG family antidote
VYEVGLAEKTMPLPDPYAPLRKKVKSGRYNNASEVVRDAVRRMEEQEAREAQLAQPAAELMLADLASEQRESIRRLVRKRLEAAKPVDVVEYAGREGLRRLADGVKARGRKKLAQARAGSGA